MRCKESELIYQNVNYLNTKIYLYQTLPKVELNFTWLLVKCVIKCKFK